MSEADRKRPLVAEDEDEGDGSDDGFELAPTDAEATIMLLRSKLYPDPQTAAAAAAAAAQSRHSKRSKTAAGPSKAAAAAITAAAAAKQLPPIVLKSQLYTVLTDRTAADRDLERLRQSQRVRVFKLAIGADEYVLLLAGDYLSIINNLIIKYQQLAAQPSPAAAATPTTTTGSTSAADAASVAATLQLFRDRVVPAWTDSSIPGATLLQLLRAPSHDASSRTAPLPAPASRSNPAGLKAAPSPEPAYERHLLAVDLLCRDIRSPDSYQLTVPGAAAFVKSVTSGRQELLQLLGRKKYNEMLEKELVCVKLRNSCLTPGFIARDLQGRGLITLTNTTAGPLMRLTQRK